MNKAQQTQMEGYSGDRAHFAICLKTMLKFITWAIVQALQRFFCLGFYFKSWVNTLLWFVCFKGIICSEWWLTIVFIVNTFRTESVNSSYLESNSSRDKCNFFFWHLEHHKPNATQLCCNGVCAGDISKSSGWINKLYCIFLKELSLKGRFAQRCTIDLAPF